MSKHIYNLKLSPVENRIPFKVAPHITLGKVPDTDVSKDIPFTENQLQIGSCVYNAGAMAAAQLDYHLHPDTGFVKLSRLAPYYYARKAMLDKGEIDDINTDSGSSGYDFCEIAKQYGLGPEELWPYDPAQFAVEPSQEYNAAAEKNQLLQFHQIPVASPKLAIELIRAALYQHGVGVMVGIKVYEDFEADAVMNTGDYLKSNFLNLLGGHEIYVVASLRETVKIPVVRILNSWGESVGKVGANGLRGFFDIAEDVFAKILLEANLLLKTE